jgi:glycosyltransferase involved in cell wall biosynthesis
LISLRFNPAFVSHLVAFAKAYQAIGLQASFLVSPEYLRFPDLGRTACVVPYAAEAPNVYTHAIFINVSQLNLRAAARLKTRGTKIIYLYHEPCSSVMAYFKTEGPRQAVMATLAHAVSIRMLKLADAVIVPSSYAAAIYGQADARYNRNVFEIPLLFDDEAISSPEDLTAKQYVSYIGAICRAHGFGQFVDFMRVHLGRDPRVRFRIASMRPLPKYVLRDPLIVRHMDRIETHCGRPLQNEEINRFYAESICVWNVYRRSTQSGVLPKAFMFGSPVLASRAGSFTEFVQDGVNGRFVRAQDPAEISSAVDEIRARIAEYAGNCRTTFTDTFFYGSKLSDLQRLL